MENWKEFKQTNWTRPTRKGGIGGILNLGYCRWMVSDEGNFKRTYWTYEGELKREEKVNIYFKGGRNRDGFNYPCLPTGEYCHRVIALAFIPNPEDKRTVNHINGDKRDNRISNLEWATDSENRRHYLESIKGK